MAAPMRNFNIKTALKNRIPGAIFVKTKPASEHLQTP